MTSKKRVSVPGSLKSVSSFFWESSAAGDADEHKTQ